jgi:hypothetical protein
MFVAHKVLRSLGWRRGQNDAKTEPVTDAGDAGHYLPVAREDFQQQIDQLNQAVQQRKSGAAVAQPVIKTEGEKHQQVI